MRTARLFKDGTMSIVTAQQVLNGEVSRYENFVDPEYEFRVIFVKAARNSGQPYFRLYVTRDEYKQFSQEQKDRYQILSTMRHFQESAWHRDWEERVSSFCQNEFYVKNSDGQCKRADAYYSQRKTIIEFQHSFIDHDFEDRNSFYEALGYNIVWLYDLTMMNVVAKEDGSFEILENNAKGFFRIAENPVNLMVYPVFIQTRGGAIFRVSRLERKEIDGDRKSTIRFFKPDLTLDESSFIKGVQDGDSAFMSKAYIESITPKGDSVYWLWKPEYQRMVVHNPERDMTILIYADGRYMNTDNETGNITYRYVVWNEKNSTYSIKSEKFYQLSNEKARARQWFLLRAFPKEK